MRRILKGLWYSLEAVLAVIMFCMFVGIIFLAGLCSELFPDAHTTASRMYGCHDGLGASRLAADS